MGTDNNSLCKREDRKKDIPVFTGVYQVKKKEQEGWLRWLCRMFFSGRSLKEICKDVAEHEVIPAAQDGLRNTVVSMLDQAIYKDKAPKTVTGSTPGSFITNYVAYGEKSSTQKALEESKKNEEETMKSGFEIPAFPSRDMAQNFLMSMHAYVKKYGTMSVHDLALMRGKTVAYTWDKWGWTAEEILAIKEISRFRDPVVVKDEKGNAIRLTHYIELPKAHEGINE